MAATVWLSRAVMCTTSGKYTEAIDCYKNSLSMFHEKCDQEGIAHCYLSLGMCCQKLYLYSEAVMNYKQGLSLYQEKGDQENTALCYLSLGECYRMLKMYSEAVINYKYGLSMYQDKGDQERIAQCYYCLGECYQTLNKYSEAVMNYEQSLSINFNHKVGKQLEGEVYFRLGGSYFSLNRYQDAKEYLDKSLTIAKQSGDWKLKWKCYISLSNLHCRLIIYREALDYAKRALEIAKTFGSIEEKHKTYAALGKALEPLGRVKEAIDYHERYLKYSKQVGDRKAEGKASLDLSLCFRHNHDNDKAIRYAKESVAIAKETGDSHTQGYAYGAIGTALQVKGKIKAAFEYHKRHLDIATQTRDKHSEASAYNNLGTVTMTLGKRFDAIRYFKTGIKQMSEVGCENADSVIYSNLGSIYASVGKYHDAIEYYKRSLHIAKESGNIMREVVDYQNLSSVHSELDLASECRWKSIILAVISGDKLGENRYFEQLGECFGKNGNLPKAITYHKKALHLALKLNNSDHIGTSYINLGKSYLQFGMVSQAIDVYEKALKIYTDSANKERAADCRSNIGVFYYHLAREQKIGNNNVQYAQNIKTSEQYIREGLECYEELFDDLREKHEFKISIVDTYVVAYNNLALLLIETKRTREALVVCDRGRACALGDTLVSKYSMQQQQAFVENIPKRKARKESELTNLLPKESCLLFYSIIDDSDHLWVLSQQQSLIYVRNEMEQNSITKKNIPEYIYQLAASAYQYMQVRQIAPNCEDRSLGKQELCYNEGYDVQSQFSTGITRMTVDQDIIDSDYLPSSCSRNPPQSTSIKSEQHNDIKEPLKELFKKLITPVQEHLTEDEVVIIPDGPLNLVPFAAFQDPETGRFLCETKRIRLAPSLTTLKILKECPDDYHCKKGALVIGNPFVGEVVFRGEKTTFSSLPAAEMEARVFSSILGVSPLIGIDATKDAVIEKLQQDAAVIHIAAHGDDTTGEIALAPRISAQSKAIPDEEDYILTMQEVQEIGVRAKLVVLSCCHSGRGEIRAEGVVGMARAFLAAGARAVVASLWAIDDGATLDFMLSFYTNLRRGRSASVSLNESMKELIREKKYSHPKYWAPFFLIGDDVTIF